MVATLQINKTEVRRMNHLQLVAWNCNTTRAFLQGDACIVSNLHNEHETAKQPITSVGDFVVQRGIVSNTFTSFHCDLVEPRIHIGIGGGTAHVGNDISSEADTV